MSSLHRRQFLQTSAALASTALLGPSPLAVSAADSAKPAAVKYRLGMVTYNVSATWDLDTVLRVAKSVGLAAVEYRTTHKHGVEPTLSKAQRKELKAKFADSGVTFWGCGSTCEFHAVDPKVVAKNIETCKQFVELVADLGGTGVKVRPNAFPKGVSMDKTLEQIGKSLIPCGQAAADAGVEICVEVHGPGTSYPPHMKTILEIANHRAVGITWNSNPTDLMDGSIDKPFAMLKPWLKSCHINDLGSKYPYARLFQLLADAGYDRYTMIEIGKTYPDVAEGEAFLKAYKQKWESLLPTAS
ncbi:sugar phosphate isomerase/epimerase family protein [Tuwongella immobilis]|uniref:Xylose isomerase-like TIM barrel domain-containing protein n=1 Tax=Tuwongella immobilis TaxID=692036 RepID=A0A6C2YM14_9BACT|nr:TIM barrel protein [Tuwongella immobilis]VIP01962.1 Xylose isomerase domain protein TIM barrel OS=Solibacter usitatus (strain Ellin6076) GN=Acid_3710 PE=4 SV=1: AP_endonuc_2 [Tuwongella immobilis]VTR99973.1 Xylose isomerase domain protein TIM barrel OS=Solibacter usitatus (strain Ellin6076) GN=Acid_3710 PE=4 SV=1: AP_endonuc_2 [Tuwongella immobilis]